MKEEIEKLVLDNMGLAYSIALKHYNNVKSFYELEDAQQMCLEGLIKAANTFDNNRGIAFSTYAYTVIKNHLFHPIIQEKQKRANQEITFVSLNDLLPDGETSFVDTIPDSYNLEDEQVHSYEVDTLYEHIYSMKEPYKSIMLLRLRNKTFGEIAVELNLSPQYVWNCYQRALNFLRDKFKLDKGDACKWEM